MSRSVHPPHHGYIGLNKYTLDLLAKFLFDRIIISVPKVPSTEIKFAIELMHKAGDDIASNGKLSFEISMTDVIIPAAPPVSQNIAAFEKKTASFVESAADCRTTYEIARNRSIACLKSIRNFNIMKISDSRSNVPVVKDFGSKTRKSQRFKAVKDSRFGSLADSFVEQSSEFLNSVRLSRRSVRSGRHGQSSRVVVDGNTGVSERFNGIINEKETNIEGSNETHLVESTGTNVTALPTLTTAKSEHSINLLYADSRMIGNK